MVLLTAYCAGLIAAFLRVPAAVSHAAYPGIGDPSHLAADVASDLSGFWRSGDSHFPSELQRLVDYWQLWHATKIAISCLLAVVVTLLAVGLWHRYAVTNRRSKMIASAAACVTALLIPVGTVVAVNVQATAAPVIALLPLLSDIRADDDLASTRASMAADLSNRSRSDATHALVQYAEIYHQALAAVAIAMTAAACVVVVVSRRRRRVAARTRFIYSVISIIAATAVVLDLTLAVYSTVKAVDPERALIDVLR